MMSALYNTQGAGVSEYHYIAMVAEPDAPARLAVYDRKGKKQYTVNIKNGGTHNGDVLGHGNDILILSDNGQDVYMTFSHMYKPGLVIVHYDAVNQTAEVTGGKIIFKPTDGTDPSWMNVSSSQWIYPAPGTPLNEFGYNIVVSATGRFWGATIDFNNVTGTQTVDATPISRNNAAQSSLDLMFGKDNQIRTGQSDWIDTDNMKLYKILSSSSASGFSGAPNTVSMVFEADIIDGTSYPVLTGKYWMVDQPEMANNEMEKVWIENGHLFVNVNQNLGKSHYTIVADLGTV